MLVTTRQNACYLLVRLLKVIIKPCTSKCLIIFTKLQTVFNTSTLSTAVLTTPTSTFSTNLFVYCKSFQS